jgi:Ecdysteroid kinase-like family
LVLENLKAQGYRGADFAEGLSLDETKAAMESLARMHSLSLVLKVYRYFQAHTFANRQKATQFQLWLEFKI